MLKTSNHINKSLSKIGVLIRIFILLLAVFLVSCSRPSRDNDKFFSKMPNELQEHYKFIDTYRGKYPDRLDSIIQLFDNRYDADSSSIESSYYNLAFAYREYSRENYQKALFRLFCAGNTIEGRGLLAFEAEINLLAGVLYRNLALNKFAKTSFKDAYNYFKDGDYPNQTMLAAFNLAWLESSDPQKDSIRIDSYVDMCDSIFVNHHDKIRYVNYYHYKYLVDQSNTDYLYSVLEIIDMAKEPSININNLYNMNLNILGALNDKSKLTKARVVLDRLDDIYTNYGEQCLSRLRNSHLFEKSIVLAKEGHHNRALDAYNKGVKRLNLTPNIKTNINRYRALYKIHYTAGNMAKSDSALILYRKAYDFALNKQADTGLSSLLEYQDFANLKNENILKNNRYHRKVQLVLIAIAFMIVAYIIYLYIENLKIKKRSQLKYNPDDRYIELLERKNREYDKRIMRLEYEIKIEQILENLEDTDDTDDIEGLKDLPDLESLE